MSMKREWVVILGTAFSALSVGAADGTIDATRGPDRSRLTIGTCSLTLKSSRCALVTGLPPAR